MKCLATLLAVVLLSGCSILPDKKPKHIKKYETIICPPRIVEGECPVCEEFVLGESRLNVVDDCKENRDICFLWHEARTKAWNDCTNRYAPNSL